MSQRSLKIGDRVVIRDGSEAHGDRGKVYFLQNNGIAIIELEDCLWPCEEDELELIYDTPTS